MMKPQGFHPEELCVNCRHHAVHMRVVPGTAALAPQHLCMRPQFKHSRVTGETCQLNTLGLSCETERTLQDYYHCGPIGQFWEPKEASKEEDNE